MQSQRYLFLYSSRNGQTLAICQRMAQSLELAGHQIQLLDLHQQPNIDWTQVDVVVIGASIRYGHFHQSLHQFIATHLTALQQKASCFFAVNLTARKEQKNTPHTNAYMKKFMATSPWQPTQLAVFAGALRYSQYNWWQTRIIQLIMKITGGSTDTSQDIDFTPWDKVEELAKQLVSLKK